jgi:AraC-like DNA-binding protein
VSPPRIIRLVGTNDRGVAIGQYHPRAKYPDELIDQIREMREDHKMTTREIAARTGVSRRMVRDVCAYVYRAQTYTNWRRKAGGNGGAKG